ncbi:HNH endonuclease [Piscibacillus salipiscarius]|uniref:HNH endonuclease n=2 Tax=Piscibacillus salipiscarius TaxID=299480 RepID=A0ABW5QER2_9BACI
MMNKEDFARYLETQAKLKPYSIGRYAGAIDTISSELEGYGLEDKNLYNLNDSTFIDVILSNPEFIKKNNKGNRMYSTAFKHFKRYIEHSNARGFQAELLKEELDFEQYLHKKPDKDNIRNIVDKPIEKPTHKSVSNRKVWYRDPRYASEAVAYANYLCEVNNQHQHFISKFNQRNYVEAHHLIPIAFQEHFDFSLDIHANIVSLCLICHKKLHYGLLEEKKEVLKSLFSSRSDRLKASGINISLEELFSYYKD